MRGGGPGTRETDLLDPAMTVERVDALALSGGSAFGLEAGAGVQALLRERGRGFKVRTARVPIVPGAIMFDLLWRAATRIGAAYPPYRELGYGAAASAARAIHARQRRRGPGCDHGDLKGGVGSASATTGDGLTVGALAVVNAAGSVVIGGGPWFWAAPFEREAEFGGRGLPASLPPMRSTLRTKGRQVESTTLVVVADRRGPEQAAGEAGRGDGADRLARALYPVHTPLDGDVVFAARPAAGPLADPLLGLRGTGRLSPPMWLPGRWRARSTRPCHCHFPALCRAGVTVTHHVFHISRRRGSQHPR